MKDIIDLPVEHYLEKIRNNQPFSLSRFGDGEVLCMFHNGWLHENCDGSKFSDDLVEPMKQIFRNQYPYYHCLLDCSFDLNGGIFKQFMEQTCPDMDFYNGEIWQHLSFSERITELIETISVHNPVFVGGSHLDKLAEMKRMGDMYLIQTPEKDSFQKFHAIYDLIMVAHGNGARFFGFCTGYTSKILIDTLFPYIGHDSFLIDFGSVFDPYCGRLSRDGMKFKGIEYFRQFTNAEL